MPAHELEFDDDGNIASTAGGLFIASLVGQFDFANATP